MTVDTSIQADLEHLDTHGYVILEQPFGDELFNAIAETSYRLERETDAKTGTDPTNELEGVRTRRTLGLMKYDRIYEQVALQPRILKVAESFLGSDCVFGSMNMFNILPGETIQPLHSDHPILPHRFPGVDTTRLPLGLVAVLAISDFTAANGATRVVPGSHKWEPISWKPGSPQQDLGTHILHMGHDGAVIAAEMRRGNVLIFDARLWHGGGANVTKDESRAGLLFAYWPGWMRPDENNLLLPKERLQAMPRRLQELIGFAMYDGLWGHMNGRDPMEWLASP
jgi:ectoine hydroxylase-related dioxygenase (phytanoyl-CoA dioxygenase family)